MLIQTNRITGALLRVDGQSSSGSFRLLPSGLIGLLLLRAFSKQEVLGKVVNSWDRFIKCWNDKLIHEKCTISHNAKTLFKVNGDLMSKLLIRLAKPIKLQVGLSLSHGRWAPQRHLISKDETFEVITIDLLFDALASKLNTQNLERTLKFTFGNVSEKQITEYREHFEKVQIVLEKLRDWAELYFEYPRYTTIRNIPRVDSKKQIGLQTILFYDNIKISDPNRKHLEIYSTSAIVKNVIPRNKSKHRNFNLTVESICAKKDYCRLLIGAYGLGRITREINYSSLRYNGIDIPASPAISISLSKLAPFLLKSKFILEIIK